jgi:hypothetical protein
MATRTETIIVRAREQLGDTRAERWTDTRLLGLLDEAQQDIAIHTLIFNGTYVLPLQEGKNTYELPDDILLIKRATFDNEPISLVTYDSMDEFSAKSRTLNYSDDDRIVGFQDYVDYPHLAWDDDTGPDVEALVFDNRNLSEIRVYPTPKDIADVTYPLVNGGSQSFVGDNVMGVVVDMEDYSFNTPYGVVVDMFDPEITNEIFNDPFGVVTGIGESNKTVQLWYTRKPNTISGLNVNPELHPLFDKALQYYVVANAFDDDVDTRSEAKAARARSKYEHDLKIVFKTAARSGVQTAKRETTYRGPFDG